MRIEFLNVAGKGPGQRSEDRVICQTDISLFGVLDGASELAGTDLDLGVSGGYWASRNLAQQLVETRRDVTRELSHDLSWLVREAEARVFCTGRFKGVPTWQLPACSGFVAMISPTHIRWLQFGDCVGVIFRKGRATILGQDAVFPYDVQVLNAMREQSLPIDHPGIQQMLRANREIRNKHGYAVVDGNLSLELCHEGMLERGGIEKMVILSDGWFHHPDSIEWIAGQVYRDGLLTSQRRLHMQEVHDPGCTIFPRFKQHDDKAGIRLTF